MDIDATTTTTNFKKPTPKECTQLAKEGRCFKCCLQGHMACHCLKNQNSNTSNVCTSKVGNTTNGDTTTTTTTTETTPTTTTTLKLMHAQQIQAIEESMDIKECSQYLNIHNMGMDFWSAGA